MLIAAVLAALGCVYLWQVNDLSTLHVKTGQLQGQARRLEHDNVLLADACSTPSPVSVTRAIHFLVQQLHGFVADSAALLAALPTPSPTKEKRP